MVTTRSRVPAMSARSGGQVLKQERVPQRRHNVAAWRVLTKLSVNLGLAIATMVEWHHNSAIHAAFGRLCAPVVITTTVHANADELQVSTMVEEKTGDASASGCRSATTPQTIASTVAKPQSAPVKSWIDRTSTWPTAAGLRWALGRGRTVTVGRPSVVWLCYLDGWSQPRAGWALDRSKRP
jgi:hypothetical protein